MNLIKNDLLMGSGFNTLLHPPTPTTTTDLEGDNVDANAITKAMQDMSLVHDWRSLKKVNILDTGNTKNPLWSIVKDGIGGATWARFCEYMKVNRLGVIPMIGLAGSGPDVSTYVALLLMQALRYLYCAAPTHAATSNFAERLFNLGTDVSKKLGPNWHAPLVVRGYKMKEEIDAFEIALQSGMSKVADPYIKTRWKIRLSLCEWLLKVVEVRGYKLAEKDPKQLNALRKEFQDQAQYSTLRLFLQGKIGSFRHQPPQGTSDTKAPCELAEGLMNKIIMRANAVCTTPHQAS